jgi:hypothetical protein
VLLLLASVGTAAADCAWVLWEQTTVGNEWAIAPIDAQIVFDTRKECEGWAKDRNESHTIASSALGRLNVRTWYCLPDTVDPRAR